MRVEIRSAGLFAILICAGVLSGAVFVMGLLAGYDIGHQAQLASQQVATTYPVQAPPAPATSASPAAVAAASLAPTAAPQRVVEQKVSGARTPQRIANEVPPPVTEPAADEDESDVAPPPPKEPPPPPPARMAAAEPPPAPAVHHRPYNIQIQAAMDSTSATEMMRRLTALGYRPHLIPTSINGETWYKVEVGPYATQTEASAAETALRARYNSAYAHGSDQSAPDAGGDEDE